jgi:hypothetical protein
MTMQTMVVDFSAYSGCFSPNDLICHNKVKSRFIACVYSGCIVAACTRWFIRLVFRFGKNPSKIHLHLNFSFGTLVAAGWNNGGRQGGCLIDFIKKVDFFV